MVYHKLGFDFDKGRMTMKTVKKLLALVLATVMLCTVAVPSAYAKEEENNIFSQVEDLLMQGFPIVSTEQFGQMLQILGRLYYMLTGKEADVSNFNVTISGYVDVIAAEICEDSGLDLKLISEHFPDINILARNLGKRYEIDTTEFRAARYAKMNEYLAEGNKTMAAVCHTIGAYMSIIELMEIYTVETDDPDVVQVMFHLVYSDGTEETHAPGLIINTKTGQCTNKDDTGMFGTGYNFSVEEMIVYTTVDCWMRNFGFCVMYDVIANMFPLSFHYVTRRFRFDYQGEEWMIQIWKGNYFISNGGEVGVYWREPGSTVGTFYNCADETRELKMSMEIYSGDKLLVNRPMQQHWWLSGFHISDRAYVPSLLTLKTTIVMRDEEMLNAFVEAVNSHYMHDVSCTVDGLNVSLVW